MGKILIVDDDRCYGCKQGELRCIVNGDMQKLYDGIAQADLLCSARRFTWGR